MSASVAETPRTMLAKNGSEKTWVFGSLRTSAIVSVRRVTRLRAIRLGT